MNKDIQEAIDNLNIEWRIKLPPEIWIQCYSELADAMVRYSALDPVTKIMDNGDECYTDEAQEKFEDCVGIVEEILEGLFIKEE